MIALAGIAVALRIPGQLHIRCIFLFRSNSAAVSTVMNRPPRSAYKHLSMAVIAATLLAAFPAHAHYHSTDVTPAGSTAGRLTAASSGQQVGSNSSGHAILLTGSALSAVDLNPVGYYSSMATGTDGAVQVGYGQSGTLNQCILWSGSSSSYSILSPSTYNQSYCFGTQGGQQIGYGERIVYITTVQNAMLWTGSAGSMVNLHPVGFTYSKGLGVYGGQQVGYGSIYAYGPFETPGSYQTTDHALLWYGTAASVIDLHPAGFDASSALSTNGTQQAGWGYSIAAVGGSHLHALLWSGSAISAVDLHPTGWFDSRITALTPTIQVGDGWTGAPGVAGSHRHALAWSGTAASVIDLNQFLPPGYSEAVATGVDAAGNVVGYAYNTPGYGNQVPPGAIAVIFAPGPASPSALASLTVTPATVAPGISGQGTVSLAGPAPVGGTIISFLSTNTGLIPTPAALTIPEGQTTASFTFANIAPGTMATPVAVAIYAADGTITKSAVVTVAPVVNLSSVSVSPVQGGTATAGYVTLSIPAQAGGATVTLVSADTTLATVPATVTVPQGYTSVYFSVSTSAVQSVTTVPITATFNGNSVTATLTLNPVPVEALSAISASSPIGGQVLTLSVYLTYLAPAGGATVTLSSNNSSVLQLPASVTIAQGNMSASFSVPTSVVTAPTTVQITAGYRGGSAVTPTTINPVPTVTVVSAEYWSISKILKVTATTTLANSTLTFGTSLNGPALATMQFEKGVWQGSVKNMNQAPAMAVVWNSSGGYPGTLAVTVRNR